MSRLVVINGMKFRLGKLTPQERFEFYKATAPGKNFQMLAPSLRKTASDKPMPYSTRIDWDQGHNWVILMRDGAEIARMKLDDWMELGAVRYAAEEFTQKVGHSLPPAETVGTAATEA